LAITRRPKDQVPKISTTYEKAVIRQAQKRGKMGLAELTSMLVKSKVDRLLAPRFK
jgi:hypothetical protein